tara:strand:+ start:220 stop:444 length:225 start_codon:yes stop_codon:yes gene_type:complete
MSKLNGLEAYWLRKGLELVLEQAIVEIEEVENIGRRPIMTAGYMIQEIEQLQKKLRKMTLKKDLKAQDEYNRNN